MSAVTAADRPVVSAEPAPRPTLLAFNTVERLFRGDFFHCVSVEDVRTALASFPGEWPVVGLGTTNWYRRNGELLIAGRASAPTFSWADPLADPPGLTLRLGPHEAVDVSGPLVTPSATDDARWPRFPFLAVAIWDPSGPSHVWPLDDGEDVHPAIATRCASANVGLAAVRISGRLRLATYQAMCHIPLGGVTPDRPAVARVRTTHDGTWSLSGLFSANPTIRSMLAHESLAAHLHGRDAATGQGGHLNTGRAGADVVVEVWPLRDLVVRISDLNAEWLPVRDLDC
jgi:hypothetical protein